MLDTFRLLLKLRMSDTNSQRLDESAQEALRFRCCKSYRGHQSRQIAKLGGHFWRME